MQLRARFTIRLMAILTGLSLIVTTTASSASAEPFASQGVSSQTPSALSPVGIGVYENTDAALVFSGAGWSTVDSGLDSGGSHSVSYGNGAAISLTFSVPENGEIAWISRQTQASGINDVYLDGVKVATVDRYSSSSKFQQVLFEQSDLSAGTHTIQIRSTGQKNGAASGASVVLDAFVISDGAPDPVGIGVYENTDAALVFSGAGWSTVDSGLDSGGSHSVSYGNGAAVSLTFSVPENGEIAWISRQTQASGINDVYLDGVKVATVDRYSAKPLFQQVQFRGTNLSQGTHTIMIKSTGEKNYSSKGASIILDSFAVIERDPPGAPTGVGSWNDGRSLRLKWTAPSDGDVAAHNIFKSSLGGAPELIKTIPVGTGTYQDFAVADGVRYGYQVTAVDEFGNESAPSAEAFSTKQNAANHPFRFASCPDANVRVNSDAELSAAISHVSPGDVIHLNPGTYRGRHVIEGIAGTAEAPIWICGPRSAVVVDPQITGGWSFHIENSSHIRLAGFTVTNSYGGVMVASSNNVTIADLHVHSIGQEAIHLRSNTTDSTVVGNLIENTGIITPQYGEGIYIGSSRANWCNYTACGPDRSDRNQILNNVISGTTAEAIEGKEGSSFGVIEGNTVSGSSILPISEAKGWIAVQGNSWIIRGNDGANSPADGIRIMEYVNGWGLGNTVSGNTASGLPGYGVYDHLQRLGTVVTCLNSTSGGGSMTNVTCQK